MEKKTFNGQSDSTRSVATSAVKVYVITNRSSYSIELKDFDFSSKEKADQFIQLMQSEGYEITQFAGEGYIG